MIPAIMLAVVRSILSLFVKLYITAIRIIEIK